MQEKKWFRPKRYGYGWFPISWQGWAVLLMYVFVLLTDAVHMNNTSHSISDFVMNFFPRVYILTVFLIIICEAKGGRARWRWGGKE
jgi:hypothetical protein